MIKNTMEARLLRSRLMATNATKHARIKQQLELFGYTPERMQELVDLIDQAEALKDEKEDYYSHQRALAKQLANDAKALKALYMEHLTIARFSFRKDTYMRNHLSLKGARKTTWAGWLEQVNDFYARIDAKAFPVMKKNGATAEEIAQGKTMAAALLEAYTNKKANTGSAQSATDQRNKVLRAIDRWVSKFKKVARVALEEDPQLLEGLGMKAASKP